MIIILGITNFVSDHKWRSERWHRSSETIEQVGVLMHNAYWDDDDCDGDACDGFADTNDDDNDNDDPSWQEAGWRHEGEDSDDEHWGRLHSCDQALDGL